MWPKIDADKKGPSEAFKCGKKKKHLRQTNNGNKYNAKKKEWTQSLSVSRNKKNKYYSSVLMPSGIFLHLFLIEKTVFKYI